MSITSRLCAHNVKGFLSARGCPAAVLRLWINLLNPPIELCGEKLATDKWQYLSDSNTLRFRYVIDLCWRSF